MKQRLGATWKWPCGIVFHAKKGYALISGHPGGVTLGKYQGMVQDLSTLFVNIKPWMGDWIAFVLSKQDLRGKMRGICSAIAIL